MLIRAENLKLIMTRAIRIETRRSAQNDVSPSRSPDGRTTMKIVVCIKQVPAKDAPLAITGNWIRESDIGFEMNEPDTYALEEALRLKEKHGGEVIVLSLGPGAREADHQGSAGQGRGPRHSRRRRQFRATRSARLGEVAGGGDRKTRNATWC